MTAEPWNLELVVGPACGAIGVLIGVWVKSQAKEAAKAEFATQIIAALAVFKSELIDGLSVRFVLQREHELMDRATHQRLDQMTGRLDVHNTRLIVLESAAAATTIKQHGNHDREREDG
jgi:hypothetical protein